MGAAEVKPGAQTVRLCSDLIHSPSADLAPLSPEGAESLHGRAVCLLCVSENAAALEELLLEYESKQLAASKGSSIK